jgi:hypothetical protein
MSDSLTSSPAFYDDDPVDLAIKWNVGEQHPIPVIMPANDKRPGGDWEAGKLLVKVYLETRRLTESRRYVSRGVSRQTKQLDCDTHNTSGG